ncbi:hypothetical protein [Gryllotalpicola daejeonensis]
MSSTQSTIARRRTRTPTGEFAREPEKPGMRRESAVNLHPDGLASDLARAEARDEHMRDHLEAKLTDLDGRIRLARSGSEARRRLNVNRTSLVQILDLARDSMIDNAARRSGAKLSEDQRTLLRERLEDEPLTNDELAAEMGSASA